MSRSRLAVVDAALAVTIDEASPGQCREIAKGVAELAAAGMDEPRIRAGFAALEAGVFGESPVRTELEALVEELDDVAWRVQEESAGDDSEYLAAFSRVRAASSLCFALDSDPRVAAAEATYEAHAALDDIEAIRAIADLVCHGSRLVETIPFGRRPMTSVPRIIGYYADAHQSSSGQLLIDSISDQPGPDDEGLANYLRGGALLATTGELVNDYLDPSGVSVAEEAMLTDGDWIWPADLAYYLQRYHVRLPDEFVGHARANGFEAPTLTREEIDAVADLMHPA